MSITEREKLLKDATQLVIGDRNVDYGDPYDDFSMTAELWHAYLMRTFEKKKETTITAEDVAAMMVLLKISRLSWTPDKRDHWLDIAGYVACGWDCATRKLVDNV